MFRRSIELNREPCQIRDGPTAVIGDEHRKEPLGVLAVIG